MFLLKDTRISPPIGFLGIGGYPQAVNRVTLSLFPTPQKKTHTRTHTQAAVQTLSQTHNLFPFSPDRNKPHTSPPPLLAPRPERPVAQLTAPITPEKAESCSGIALQFSGAPIT